MSLAVKHLHLNPASMSESSRQNSSFVQLFCSHVKVSEMKQFRVDVMKMFDIKLNV